MQAPAVALARMHFAAQATHNTGPLADLLAQWMTPVTSIVLTVPGQDAWTVSRLDGKYEACPWPSENQALDSVVDGGDGCQPLADPDRLHGKWVFVTSDGCSAAVAAEHGSSSGAAGTIVAAASGSLPEELQACKAHGVVTMVGHEDGLALRATLKDVGGNLSGSFASIRRPGAFAAVDAAGRLQEVGWEKYSTLEMLAWSAQYFDYLAALEKNLTKPHFRVPVFDQAFGGTAVVNMPPASVLRGFSRMEVEHRLSCADGPRMDEVCPAWDHNIALGVVCAPTAEQALALGADATAKRVGNNIAQPQLSEPGGFSGELARYITPFRRRIGHFLTPATTLMPYFLDESTRSCAFRLSGPGGWASTISLRFSGNEIADGAPPTITTELFQGGGFGSDYNDNRTMLVAKPAHGRGAVTKVELSFILSGHGECEFMPTTHVFFVNGDEFRWSSEGVAGTGMGCTRHVREGRVQPNEHGTWYTGRNGWCARPW
eukprot:SAG31_NODE_4650_length_3068_cov_2.827888_2_plen_488_part_00